MLDRYLQRIGLKARPAPDAHGLALLHRAHLFAVPFENLDIWRGIPITLDEAACLDKVVVRRRGGFCYELNASFAWLLRELGFAVTLLSANVAGANGWGIDYDHMLLRVDLGDEPWLADVGFGDSFVEPLRLAIGTEQAQAIGTFRIGQEGGALFLERHRKGRFERELRFHLESHDLADFAPGCTYHQSPASHFTNGPICSLALPEGRVSLTKNTLIENAAGKRTETAVTDATTWHRLLAERFGICQEPG